MTETADQADDRAMLLDALEAAHNELTFHPVSNDIDVRRAREKCEAAIAKLQTKGGED